MINFGDVLLKIRDDALYSLLFTGMAASSFGGFQEVMPSSGSLVFGSIPSNELRYLDYSKDASLRYELKVRSLDIKKEQPKCLESCLEGDSEVLDRLTLYSEYHPFP